MKSQYQKGGERVLDKKQQEQYKKQLEYFREIAENEEYDFQKLKDNNPKYVKEINKVLEISGFNISLTEFEKPILKGFQRSDESINDGVQKRLESLELREQMQSELDEFSKKYPFISKDDSEAIEEFKKIKEKYKDSLVIRKDNERRKINKLKTLIQSNFDEWTHFITLTHHHNELDVKRAKERFKKWAKDMNKIVTDFKYVNVLEFQERGAVHFHVVCKCTNEKGVLAKSQFMKVRKTWEKHGSINIKGIKYKYDREVSKELKNKVKMELKELSQDEQMAVIWSLGSYLTSYLEKGADNMLLFGSKMYGYSKGLKESIKITEPKKIAQILRYLGTGGLKENSYEIEIPQTENKLTKTYWNKLMKDQTKE